MKLSKLSKEDALFVIGQTVKHSDKIAKIKITFKPSHKMKNVSNVIMFDLIILFAIGIFGKSIMQNMPDSFVGYVVNLSITLVTLITAGLFLVEVLYYFYLESENAPDDAFGLYTRDGQDAINDFGLSDDIKFIISADKAEQFSNNIFNLIVFNCMNGRRDTVKQIVAQYDDLSAIVRGLSDAWEAKDYNVDTVARLRREYIGQLNELVDRLYKLAEDDANKLVFNLIKNHQYQYLPSILRKNVVRDYNERLLDDIRRDDE